MNIMANLVEIKEHKDIARTPTRTVKSKGISLSHAEISKLAGM